MPHPSNKRRRKHSHKAKKPRSLPDNIKWSARTWQVLVSLGLIGALPALLYAHLTGMLSLKFNRPEGRAYAFTLTNTSPAEKTIQSLRILLPSQKLVNITTQDVLASQNPDGSITLPGGNMSYVPAMEFNALDGRPIAGRSSLDFHIPPLTSRAYMQPEAVMVYVHYAWQSSNRLLRYLDRLAVKIGLETQEATVRYVVQNNVWDVSPTDDPGEALRRLCRDDDQAATSETCIGMGSYRMSLPASRPPNMTDIDETL